jgi:hypothetical protein
MDNFNNNNNYGPLANRWINDTQRQPAPIGSLLNNGYNNNTYTGYYNQRFVNPYTLQQQQERYQNQFKNQYEQDYNNMKSLIKNLRKFDGMTEDEEVEFDKTFHDRYSYETYQRKEQERAKIREDLYYDDNTVSYPAPPSYGYVNAMNIILSNLERNKKYNDTRLIDYMKNNYAQEKTREISDEIISSRFNDQSQIQGIYNRSQYNDLINMHSNSRFYNELNRGPNVDDLTVSLPSHFSEERARRKARFMEKILNG